MADFRLPGPADASRQHSIVDDGTLVRRASMPPGSLRGAIATQADGLDPWTLLRRAACVKQAAERARARVPAAVLRETGEALEALIDGLLPGLLMMMAVLGVSVGIGGAAGAAIGALAGGVGAAPGAVIGAKAGAGVGIWLLTWLGLGFLAVEIGRGLIELGGRCLDAVRIAWEAHGQSDREARITRAADGLADAVALLLKLILMAIVARLTMSQAGAAGRSAAASVDEMVALLRQSRLGAGFADWVAANAARLVRNPKLQMHRQVQGTQAVNGSVTPSQLRRGNALEPAPAPAPVKVPRRTVLRTRNAEEVNASYPKEYKPPYKPSTKVTEFRTEADEVFVRVHGESNQARSWMMEADEIKGLSAEQIKSKFALPELPSYASEVHVPAGTTVRTGVVNPIFGGTGNATQFELLSRLPSSAFQNMRPLGGGG